VPLPREADVILLFRYLWCYHTAHPSL